MTNLYLEKKVLLEGSEEEELDYPIELEYYLTESEGDASDEPAGTKHYGIGIIKKAGEECQESMFISDLSSYITRAKEILGKLIRNSVTPVALNYVLEDLIGV